MRRSQPSSTLSSLPHWPKISRRCSSFTLRVRLPTCSFFGCGEGLLRLGERAGLRRGLRLRPRRGLLERERELLGDRDRLLLLLELDLDDREPERDLDLEAEREDE